MWNWHLSPKKDQQPVFLVTGQFNLIFDFYGVVVGGVGVGSVVAGDELVSGKGKINWLPLGTKIV